MAPKGCSAWSKLLKTRYKLDGVYEMERKQETRLNALMGLRFWSDCYFYTKSIKYNNKVKWMQFQILRGILQVNYVVSKYNPAVDVQCTFCGAADETIRHLFYDCAHTRSFIEECFAEIETYGHRMSLNEFDCYEILFIEKTRTRNYKTFFFMIYIKYFIWCARCKKIALSIVAFKHYIKKEIEILVECLHVYKNLTFLRDVLERINDQT